MQKLNLGYILSPTLLLRWIFEQPNAQLATGANKTMDHGDEESNSKNNRLTADIRKENEEEDSPRRRWKIHQTIERLEHQLEQQQRQSQKKPVGSTPNDNDNDDNVNDGSLAFLLLQQQVLTILRHWATEWSDDLAYKSFLDKKSFQHEIEECLPALHHLNQWRQQHRQDFAPTTSTTKDADGLVRRRRRFVAMDICGGKGCFAMLLQYMASFYWNSHIENNDECNSCPTLDHVILLEKCKHSQVDWHHLISPPPSTTKRTSSTDSHFSKVPLIPVVIWDDCNLHESDALVDRIQDTVSPYPVALTGIHLCKLLSPALISLANLLGPRQCPYLCLAPCCMPRAITKTKRQGHFNSEKKKKFTSASSRMEDQSVAVRDDDNILRGSSFIQVFGFETDLERTARLLRMQRRNAAQRRRGRPLDSSCSEGGNETEIAPPPMTGCFRCHSINHVLRFCPEIQNLSESERRRIHRIATPLTSPTPCWNCGIAGHFQADCLNPRISTVATRDNETTSLLDPPRIMLDVTNILRSSDPMKSYCDLLIESVHATNFKQTMPNGDNTKNESFAQLDSRFPLYKAIWKTDLINIKAEKQAAANWNKGRKCHFMVVYAKS